VASDSVVVAWRFIPPFIAKSSARLPPARISFGRFLDFVSSSLSARRVRSQGAHCRQPLLMRACHEFPAKAAFPGSAGCWDDGSTRAGCGVASSGQSACGCCRGRPARRASMQRVWFRVLVGRSSGLTAGAGCSWSADLVEAREPVPTSCSVAVRPLPAPLPPSCPNAQPGCHRSNTSTAALAARPLVLAC